MSLRIIFMGTPEFAVGSLQKLVEAGCQVVAVVTAPDKPAGRGQSLSMSPVKQYALQQQIPVLQPEKLKNPEFLDELRGFQADLQVVVAFRMLPEMVWNMPPRGTFNLHASLLPQYRGAAPINWAIINGETQTGVSTFFIEHEIDTGQLIFQEPEPIFAADNVGTLYERLMQKGADLVLKTVQAIETGTYPQIPQPQADKLNAAPKLFKEMGQVDWQKSAVEIKNLVRGLSPYPAAWTLLADKTLKLFEVAVVESIIDLPETPTGHYTTDHKKYLYFKAADGWISVLDLQQEGKKRMKIDEFLRGARL